MLGRDWQLLLWVPVRGCLHVAALALKPPSPPALPPLTVLLGTSLPLLAGWLAEEAGHYPGTTHSSHAGCSPGSHGVADLPEPQFPLLSSRGTGPLMLKGLAPRPGSSSLPLRRVCPAPHSSSICWRFPRPGRSGAAHSPLRPVPAPPSRPPPWLASPVAMSRAPSQSPQAASSRSLPLLGVPPTHPLTLPLGRLQFLYLSTHCAS